MRFPARSLVACAVAGALASGGAVLTLSGGAGQATDVPVPTFVPALAATAAPARVAPPTAPSAPVTGADIAAQGLPGDGATDTVTRRSTAVPEPEADRRAEFVDRLPARMRDRIREACANDEFDGEICEYV